MPLLMQATTTRKTLAVCALRPPVEVGKDEASDSDERAGRDSDKGDPLIAAQCEWERHGVLSIAIAPDEMDGFD
jgi:hypothetical protein